MQFFKLNSLFYFLILVFLSFNIYSMEIFSTKQCLELNSQTLTTYRDGIFGLVRNNLTVKKDKCSINIQFSRFKFFNHNWEIDVCRSPIHIKQVHKRLGHKSLTILKKDGPCRSGEGGSSAFCKEAYNLLLVLQDHGLIIASGEKENITSDYGQIFCSFLLLKYYLQKNNIFSRHEKLKFSSFPTEDFSEQADPDQEKRSASRPLKPKNPNLQISPKKKAQDF